MPAAVGGIYQAAKGGEGGSFLDHGQVLAGVRRYAAICVSKGISESDWPAVADREAPLWQGQRSQTTTTHRGLWARSVTAKKRAANRPIASLQGGLATPPKQRARCCTQRLQILHKQPFKRLFFGDQIALKRHQRVRAVELYGGIGQDILDREKACLQHLLRLQLQRRIGHRREHRAP